MMDFADQVVRGFEGYKVVDGEVMVRVPRGMPTSAPAQRFLARAMDKET
jgi:hypothetical protein